MTPPRDVWQLDTRHIGRRVWVYDHLPSTNDIALSLASDSANVGTIVIAEHQTAGRGQHGRIWQSRPGASLLMSVLLAPPTELRRPVILTAWAAVAVGEAIRELTGVQARIKWPNDLLVRGKKVCGILIEQTVGTVVGIGLNLNQSADDFRMAGLPDASSLGIIASTSFDLQTALAAVVRQLDDEYDRLLSGERVPLESDWKWRIGLLGRQVTIEFTDGSTTTGRLREMAFDGLALEEASGVRIIQPEAVRHIYDASREPAE